MKFPSVEVFNKRQDKQLSGNAIEMMLPAVMKGFGQDDL